MPDVSVHGTFMHYEEEGAGPAFVFLHGNPGSSRLWREVIPRVGRGLKLAPDLIGMGQSGKPDIPYLFADHARYLDAWFDALALDRVVLVGHDWGGALAFDWATRHPARVAGIAFTESIVKPLNSGDLSPQARKRAETIRDARAGEELGLDTDGLVRQAFTKGVLTSVAAGDLQAYLAPYPTRESRRPLLAWARQMPIDGEPAELVERIEAFDAWLASSGEVPKLLMTFEGSPTLLITRDIAAWCADNMAALETVACGQAGHHAPEDQPEAIAAAISAWADHRGLR
jgi:haloalkane dehalogenase